MKGQSYLSVKNKLVEGKIFVMITKCCKMLCYKQFNEVIQKELFEKFWSISNYDKQNYLLYNLMSKKSRKDEVNEQKENVKFIKWNFFLTNGLAIHVCKEFFLNVLQVSKKRIEILQNKKSKGHKIDDQRGQHDNSRKISIEIWDLLHEIIERILKIHSHYSLEKTKRLYFENKELNISSLYKHFIEILQENYNETISFWSFIKYFKENFNIGFAKPKSDICDYCYEIMILGTQNLTATQLNNVNKHQEDVQKYRFYKKEILDNKKYLSIEVDYAQNKPLPKLSNTKNFYKSNLWMYLFNLHIHNNEKETYFYYFIEGEFRKGSESVASFIYDYISRAELNDFEKIVIFSDACGGQNRNYLLMKVISLFAIYYQKTFLQVFPIRGHSYNVCDKNFANFTKKVKKKQAIEMPREYLDILTELRYKHLKGMVFDWQTLFDSHFEISKSKMEISKYYKIEYLSNGLVRTYKEFDDKFSEFKLFDKILSNWKENLKVSKKHFVNKDKVEDTIDLLQYIKPENRKFYLEYFNEYSVK